MENQLIMKDITDLSPQYQEAMELHRQIMANGVMAALALVDLCKNLKSMRDKKAYEHLGYDSFDDYVEQMAHIKRRQAYNYISTYERLGPEFLQSNAQLGITKLELLAQLPEPARESIVASADIEEKSARELKELVAELTKAREQISFLTAGKDSVEQNLQETDQELAEKDSKIAGLQSTINRLTAEIKDLEKKSKNQQSEIKEKIEKDVRAQVQSEMSKTIEEAKRKAVDARNEGIEAGREAVRKSLEAVEKEKAAAIARAQELEKQLKVAGNSESVIINHLFSEMTAIVGKLQEAIGRIEAGGDQESAAKFRTAIVRYMQMAEQRFTQG